MDVTSYLLGKKSGGGSKPPVLQDKEVTITENGTTNVTADAGYDGLSEVEVTTNVPTSGPDLSEYFDNTITTGNSYVSGWQKLAKKIPNSPLTLTGTNLQYVFYAYKGNTIPQLVGDTSNVTKMNSMFGCCSNITNLDLSYFDTSNVTTMSEMFYACTNLESIDFGNNFNTASVTNMSSMFNNCSKLTTVPAFNTSNVTNMKSMFDGCSSLVTCPSLNTSKVTDFRNMFQNCKALENIPIFDASSSNILSYAFFYMFNGCNNLSDTSLDNILQMCISATSYTGTKTLYELRLFVDNLQTRIQALPHYQDFIDAGWTIGY